MLRVLKVVKTKEKQKSWTPCSPEVTEQLKALSQRKNLSESALINSLIADAYYDNFRSKKSI